MKKLLFKVTAVVMIAIFIVSEGEPILAKDNPGEIYRRFLKRNESKFVVEECDWDTVNSEDNKKSDYFLLVDLNKDGTPELVCNHPLGYKQDMLYIYTIRNGKVRLVKGAAGSDEINISNNAAGRFEVYGCQNGHLHVNWFDGWMGHKNQIYKLDKNGEFYCYLEDSVTSFGDSSVEPTYLCNGKEITKQRFEKITKKCKEQDWLKKNDRIQRNHIQTK